ncbi:hypothetical protein [Amycolatopsis alkalitolerans]|uniref:Uncharacterized protein n=1 Tax=Amycolatopsis alkalitolerans TaxID=2547244 RepID=A0A5C4M305_9PSEU|nr:hypothetical protein [Amycolatopsis alkalitolerans]TNC25181.1 hypothetical protein FG385_16190 [Amycolatopsis alkalitolerans]
MNTTVLATGEALAPAIRLAERLTGATPGEVVLPGHALLSVPQVLMIGSPVLGGQADADLERFLKSVCSRLSGVVAFVLTVGSWPADARVADLLRKSCLVPAGAVCPAPGLHLQRRGGTASIARFAAFWGPALPALLDIGRRARSAREYEGKQS